MSASFIHLHLADGDRRKAVIRRAEAEGFRTVDRMGEAWVGWRGRESRPATRRRDLLVLGFWQPHHGGDACPDKRLTLDALITGGWGRYVALTRDPDGRVAEALRDPSGAMEVACWTSNGAQIVASGTPDWLWSLLPGSVTVDWPGVGGMLDDPLAMLARPPLEGLDVLDAGGALDLGSRSRRQIWRPADHARAGSREAASRSHLVAHVERCVDALSGDDGCDAVEISGGLDSAIVASTLARLGRRPVALNCWHGSPGADERAYARSVAVHLGLRLTIRERAFAPPTTADLLAMGGDLRPATGRSDSGFDTTLAALMSDLGVTRQFTGKGGDAVFLQGWGPDLLSDYFQRWGPLGWLSPLPYRLARLSRRSIRGLMHEARRATLPTEDAVPLASGPVRIQPHPWLDGAEGLPPGKSLQLRALVSNLSYATPSRRYQQADVIHPLMSQPIVEWALRTPTWVLMNGRRDRSFARGAFARRLPALVIDRRSKGHHGHVQSHELSRALPALRDHLLQGELTRRGVIDPDRLEPLLDRDQLAWRGGAPLLARAAMVESWARRWAARERGRASRTPGPER